MRRGRKAGALTPAESYQKECESGVKRITTLPVAKLFSRRLRVAHGAATARARQRRKDASTCCQVKDGESDGQREREGEREGERGRETEQREGEHLDRKSTRLNSSH